MPTPQPWSHSAINAFDTCPRQFAEVKVLKHFKQSSNAAADWGNEAHTAFELALKGEKPLDKRFETYAPYLQKFKDMPGQLFAEQEYALNRYLRPTGFYAEDVWCRGIIDVLILNGFNARVDDHKTGKRKKDMQQLIIFALLVFYHHPEVLVVDTGFQWLQTGEEDRETFQRGEIPQLWDTLLDKLGRYRDAFHYGVFPPKRSGLCKAHCPVDTCEYWGQGRR